VPPILAAMLWSRGLRDDAPDHLNPPLELSGIPSLATAAERLEHAIRERRRILIHGDYDADGISGTAVLLLGLRELGANVEAFIPNRLEDGYGIHPDRVEEHAARCQLFVTVDCGISNIGEIARLNAAGVETIVTDHHTPGEATPEGLIVHPGSSPLARDGLPQLTGAGVAFHLLWSLRQRLGMSAPLEYADLAAIGTIADVAALLGENRALIVEGLKRLGNSRWPGVRASVRQAHLRGDITAREVAFVLAPRLNAAGRLGEADLGLELLTTASERRASELAAYLDARNQDRRRIQDDMLEQALEIVDPEAPALVVEDPRWHPGVMGIVASKLLERFYKPVYIVASGKGSVRSTPGISAVDGLRHAAAHLRRFGGHAQAAGFALDMAALPAFRDAIYDYAAQFPTPQPLITADAVLAGTEVDSSLWQAIRSLEPFGEGHPPPMFALTDSLESARAVGRDGATLQLRIGGVKGVAWKMGHRADALSLGEPVNAAVVLNENEWHDRRTLEFIAEALRPAMPLGLASSDALTPGGKTAAPSAFEAGVKLPRIVRGGLATGLPAGGSGSAVVDAAIAPLAPARTAELEAALSMGSALWLTRLPDDEPVAAARLALAGASLVAFDLDGPALTALEACAAEYPTLDEVRQAFVALSRGLNVPFAEPKAGRVRAALRELELLDPAGRPLSGRKRDPYSSDVLLDGLVLRHLLLRFVTAYRHLDDNAFARTALTLFGPFGPGDGATALAGPGAPASEAARHGDGQGDGPGVAADANGSPPLMSATAAADRTGAVAGPRSTDANAPTASSAPSAPGAISEPNAD